MKGQTFVDFYVSLTIFVLFAAYIFFQIYTLLPQHLNAIKSQLLHSEAYQISEMLVTDSGQPSNWETLQVSQIQRIGLMNGTQNKTNLLSLAKIQALNTICNSAGGYTTLQNLLATNNSISISVIDKVTGSVIASCTPTSAPYPLNLVNMTRIIAIGGDYGELILQVW